MKSNRIAFVCNLFALAGVFLIPGQAGHAAPPASKPRPPAEAPASLAKEATRVTVVPDKSFTQQNPRADTFALCTHRP